MNNANQYQQLASSQVATIQQLATQVANDLRAVQAATTVQAAQAAASDAQSQHQPLQDAFNIAQAAAAVGAIKAQVKELLTTATNIKNSASGANPGVGTGAGPKATTLLAQVTAANSAAQAATTLTGANTALAQAQAPMNALKAVQAYVYAFNDADGQAQQTPNARRDFQTIINLRNSTTQTPATAVTQMRQYANSWTGSTLDTTLRDLPAWPN